MAARTAATAAAVYEGLKTSVERLSAGLRINSVKDDAAGLAIRQLLRADIATAKQAANNVRDGISMLQTADASAAAISGNLIRMKQLAGQAANSTYSAQQKSIIQAQFGSLADEIAHITETTAFNGIALYKDGQTIEIALGDGETITIDTQTISISSADLTADPAAAQLAVDTAISRLTSYRGSLGAKANRLENAADAINAKTENLLATDSRISDADMAKEVTSMTASRILISAALAAQSQSNAISRVVHMLLT